MRRKSAHSQFRLAVKVLLIADWNPLHGGAEAYTLQLRDALTEAGDEVRLLTANVSAQARQVADHLAPASDHVVAKSLLQISNPFAAATVRSAVRAFQPQLALVNMFALYLSPSAIFALGDIPYILLVSDYKCICPLGHRLLPDNSVCHHPVGIACLRNRCLSLPHWLRDQLRYRRIDEVVRKAAAIVSTSDSLRTSLAEQGIDSRRVYIFSDPPGPPLPRRPDPAPLFLFLGRLDIEKGVDTLLRAFAICHESIPESRLRIIGRGELRPSLERLATRLGVQDSVVFCGWKEPGEVNHELSHAWALVAPSRWPEPFGLVALEAIFSGVPAVVPALGGLAETVEHGVTGLVYPADDIDALSDQLLNLATGRCFPEHTLDLAQVAQVQDQYSRQRHIRQMKSIMHEIVPSNQ
jgi:glycosyltransferase involved in cell wall biosynthesis